jgi:hypothetical protein
LEVRVQRAIGLDHLPLPLRSQCVVTPLDVLTGDPSALHHVSPHRSGTPCHICFSHALLLALDSLGRRRTLLGGVGHLHSNPMTPVKATYHLTLGLHPLFVLVVQVPDWVLTLFGHVGPHGAH